MAVCRRIFGGQRCSIRGLWRLFALTDVIQGAACKFLVTTEWDTKFVDDVIVPGSAVANEFAVVWPNRSWRTRCEETSCGSSLSHGTLHRACRASTKADNRLFSAVESHIWRKVRAQIWATQGLSAMRKSQTKVSSQLRARSGGQHHWHRCPLQSRHRRGIPRTRRT
jgi:hypothetical protein